MPPRAVRSRRYPQSLAMAKSQRIAESRMQIQGPTCPMSVCLFVCLSMTCVRSAGCQAPKKPRHEHNIPIATWSRELQEEFEDYKRADHDGRRLLWYKWTKLERRSVEGAAPRLRAEMRTFKEELLKLAEQPVVRNSQGQVPQSSSWVRDQTQDGDVHPNPGPPKKDQRQHLVKRRSDANQAHNSGRKKSQQRPIQRHSSDSSSKPAQSLRLHEPWRCPEPAAVIGLPTS